MTLDDLQPPDVERTARILEHLASGVAPGSLPQDLGAIGFAFLPRENQFNGMSIDTLAKAAEEELVTLRNVLKQKLWLRAGDPAKPSDPVSYLRPIVEAQVGSTIVTLNYDNTLDVIAGVTTTGSDKRVTVPPITSTTTRVLKLHGSLDWRLINETVLANGDPTSADPYKPAIVFGAGNKLRHYGPFLDLLREFRDVLSRATHVVTLGYGFRDEHVNEFITRWVRESHTFGRTPTLVATTGRSGDAHHMFLDDLDANYDNAVIERWPGAIEDIAPLPFRSLVLAQD